ncbi:MAG TPA: hypothetical protein EYG40_13815 [Verrucomicrobia bacterium]|nr:hypothetical protein [Verrucomicrobiales bacterium]HIL56099.1 hypothetical protein [Verrucomicrobiota bacterium]
MDKKIVTRIKLMNPALCVLILLMGADLRAGDSDLSARVVRTTIREGKVDMSVRLFREFDWKRANYISKKTFPGDAPPWLPNPPRTRHQLVFGVGGIFEWFQFDFIEIGNYKFVDDFTVTAQRFGGNVIVGVFDPVKNVLLFDGLEYVPELPIPEIKIKASNDLVNWIDISGPKEVSREFNWGDSISVSFDHKDRGSEYFLIEVNNK